jgi:hypothetical protein
MAAMCFRARELRDLLNSINKFQIDAEDPGFFARPVQVCISRVRSRLWLDSPTSFERLSRAIDVVIYPSPCRRLSSFLSKTIFHLLLTAAGKHWSFSPA